MAAYLLFGRLKLVSGVTSTNSSFNFLQIMRLGNGIMAESKLGG